MSIVRRNNLMFPTLMNDFFKPDWFGGMERYENTLPAVNIKENETNYELELAIPGQKKEDFNVEIDDSIMTVSMESRSEETKSDEQYTRKEFSYRSFKRSFTLPETVDEDKIEASYVDGILKFSIPKREEALPKPKRTIAIGQ